MGLAGAALRMWARSVAEVADVRVGHAWARGVPRLR